MGTLKHLFLFIIFVKQLFGEALNIHLLKSWSANLINIEQFIIISCYKKELFDISKSMIKDKKIMKALYLDLNISLTKNIGHTNFGSTGISVNVCCHKSINLIENASSLRYLNKTYQWFLWDGCRKGANVIFSNNLKYLGPNSQITYANISLVNSTFYSLWDIHSKGIHLQSPLEINLIGKEGRCKNKQKCFYFNKDIQQLQSFQNRKNFNGLRLRGVTVIDKENICKNFEIESILSISTKDFGVSAFTKYHYEVINIVSHHLNFVIDFRNARGWAGRIVNSTFRIGFLGIMKRSEADVGVSGIFNRINRFAEFDIIYQGWKFETAFIYRYTPKLKTQRKYGNFLLPFKHVVWIYIVSSLLGMVLTLMIAEIVSKRIGQNILKKPLQLYQKTHINVNKLHNQQCDRFADFSTCLVLFNTWAAFCQQGLHSTPKAKPSRMVILTIYLFSLVIYNFYTSSVVGKLLSTRIEGPSNVNELLSSSLKLSFEDIGYYKILFKENKSKLIARILEDLQVPRNNLPVYLSLENAIPLIRNGSIAFHCEVVDAYPIIANNFNEIQICDLRIVFGLMESEIMNLVLDKNSQYTEHFRISTGKAREVGLTRKLLLQRQPKKPICQALYTVYPVQFDEVTSLFFILGCFVLGTTILTCELLLSNNI